MQAREATGPNRARSPERDMIAESFSPGFVVHQPTAPATPFVFSSPHSGRHYPVGFLGASRLNPRDIRRSEDSFVDTLFENVTALGAPLIATQFPRAYLDLNREPFELDPLLFREPVPAFANTCSLRVTSGLGTLARVVADGEAIYDAPLPLSVAYDRIALLYRPFHMTLEALLTDRRNVFGRVVLIDCHSMPSSTGATSNTSRPDIILGDRFGQACCTQLTLALKQALTDAGFNVALNRPYAGGFITEHYGRPGENMDAIQIELNRALYMDENSLRQRTAFTDVQKALEQALATMVASYPASGRFAEAAE